MSPSMFDNTSGGFSDFPLPSVHLPFPSTSSPSPFQPRNVLLHPDSRSSPPPHSTLTASHTHALTHSPPSIHPPIQIKNHQPHSEKTRLDTSTPHTENHSAKHPLCFPEFPRPSGHRLVFSHLIRTQAHSLQSTRQPAR